MKIVVLTRKNATSCYTVNRLNPSHDYSIILEKPDKKRVLLKKLKRYIKKNGFFKGTYIFIKFVLELPYILKETKKLLKYIATKLRDKDYNNVKNIYHVNRINNKKTISLIKQIDPKLILVIGTSIISKKIINTVKKKGRYFLNWHAGVTPEYRGCKSEFYCIINNEIEMVGSTIHHVDKGVDTGSIVMQEKIKLTAEEKKQLQYDYKYLRYKNVILVINMLNKLILDLDNNKLKPFRKKVLKSQIYSTPRKEDYKKYYSIVRKNNY